MRETIFRTGGDWDSTTLHVNGVELPADRLLVELRAGEEDDDHRVGHEPIGGEKQDGAEVGRMIDGKFMAVFAREMSTRDD